MGKKIFRRNIISVEKVYLRKYRAVRYEMRPIAIAYLKARRARGTIFFYRYIIPDGISSTDILSLSFRQSSIPLVRKRAEAVQGCIGITNAYTHTIGITNADEREASVVLPGRGVYIITDGVYMVKVNN